MIDMGKVKSLIKIARKNGDKLRDLADAFGHNGVYVFVQPAEHARGQVRYEPAAASPQMEKTVRYIAKAYGLTEPVAEIVETIKTYVSTASGAECPEAVTRYMRQKPVVQDRPASHSSRSSGSTHRSS
jgi:hypothetical protein